MFNPTPKIFHMQNLIFFLISKFSKLNFPSSTNLAHSRCCIKSLWSTVVYICCPQPLKKNWKYLFFQVKKKKRREENNTENPLEPLKLLMSLVCFPDIYLTGLSYLHTELMPCIIKAQFFITSLILCTQWLFLLVAVLSFFPGFSPKIDLVWSIL